MDIKATRGTILGVRSDVLACLFLVVATAAVYYPITDHAFTSYDDPDYITANRQVQAGISVESIRWALTATRVRRDSHGNWHPLTWISHMLDCQFFGMNAGLHHLTSLIMHIIGSLLLFAVFRKMSGRPWCSFMVASLFALHPLHVESVAWASERKDVLSNLFWWLTIWCYLKYAEAPRKGFYLAALLCYGLGLMAKSMLVSLPLILLLLDFWPLKRLKFSPADEAERQGLSPSSVLIEKIPFGILSAAVCVITYWVQQNAGVVGTLDRYPLQVRLANALVSYASYIIDMFWPVGLAVLYPHPGTIPFWKAAGAGSFLIIVTVLAINTARRWPFFLVGWLWYLITLVPVIGLVQVGVQARADRYTYIPLTGLFIIIVWGLPEALKRWRLGTALLSTVSVLAIAALSTAAWVQTHYWKNSLTLYAHTLAVTSGNYRIHFNYGVALSEDGQVGAAIRHYLQAVQLKPDYAIAHNNLGNAYAEQGQDSLAIRHYRKALQSNPSFALAHNNLAEALSRRGEYDAAVRHYRSALEVQPNRLKILMNLADVLLLQKDYDQSIEICRRVLAIKPNNDKAQRKLETALRLKREDPAGR